MTTILEFEQNYYPYLITHADLIADHLRPDETYVDIGANTGLLSRKVLDILNDRNIKLKSVILFEPIDRLSDECKLKLPENYVVIETVGLSDKTEENVFYISEYNLGYNKIYKDGMEIHPHEKRTIKCISFSEYVKSNNITNVGFIKIDAEGHDIPIIKGMFDWLDNVEKLPFILFEGEWDIEEEKIFINYMTIKYMYEPQNFGRDILLKPINKKTTI